MTISMYQASVPLFQRQLGAMLNWLEKAEAHAQARKFDANNYLQLRLAPDMLPFVSQIRIASDAAKGCVARLAGVEIPKFEDNETTLAELKTRIASTLAWLDSVPADVLDGREDVDVTFPVGREATRTLKGADYLRHWALPNVMFHVTTTYALMRHNGVELGKQDFLLGPDEAL
jgi:hypothetical protein